MNDSLLILVVLVLVFIIFYNWDNNSKINFGLENNNKKLNLDLPKDFSIFDYTNHAIRIGDDKNTKSISVIEGNAASTTFRYA